MLDFLSIGRESASTEKTRFRHFFRSVFGHLGLGYAVRYWNLKAQLSAIKHPVHNILDFGCSDGMLTFYVTKQFPGSNTVAVDGDTKSINYALKAAQVYGYKNIKFRTSAFEDALPESAQYDLVLCLDAIYYTEHGHRYISALCRSLRPGGTLILSLPYLDRHYGKDFYFFGGKVDRDSMIELYSPDVIEKCILQEGMTKVSCTNYPDNLSRKFIRDQAAGKRYTLIFYPLLLAYVWIKALKNSPSGTHVMIVAKKQ